ncbi:MAG: hypothetical protein QM644_20080 [Mobilitalea sp.]
MNSKINPPVKDGLLPNINLEYGPSFTGGFLSKENYRYELLPVVC